MLKTLINNDDNDLITMFQKDRFDKKIIDSAFKNTGEEANEVETHVVYAGRYYNQSDYQFNLNHEDRLRSFILEGMKKYKIKTVMVTSIYMLRIKLITKENMENYCTGKEYATNSINDDIELLFEDLRLGKAPSEIVQTYFLPKLTEEELELVEKKDSHYLQTFSTSQYLYISAIQNMIRWGSRDHPDVSEAEMKASESKSKFLQGKCYRRTYTIKNLFLLKCSNSCSLQ